MVELRNLKPAIYAKLNSAILVHVPVPASGARSQMIETIRAADVPIALVIRAADVGRGTEFITEAETSLQVALIAHPRGHHVAAHKHQIVSRVVTKTCEALVIRKGRIRVDLFDDQGAYCDSRELRAGDAVLLLTGGHGVEVLDDVDMIEVKTGPYAGDRDKTILVDAVVPAAVRGRAPK